MTEYEGNRNSFNERWGKLLLHNIKLRNLYSFTLAPLVHLCILVGVRMRWEVE